MAAVVSEIVRGVRARGKEVAVVYIPSKWQYDPSSHDPMSATKLAEIVVRESWLSGELEIDRRLAELAKQVQVPFLNLTGALREEAAKGTGLNWQHDTHLNPAGDRFVAERISAWIKGDQVFKGME